MWNQQNLSAPWGKVDLLNLLTTILTDSNVGFTLYDDESASFKKTFRLNLGAGKDLCWKFQLTDISGGCRIQSWFFETADYSLSTHVLPANVIDQGQIDFSFTTNLLINLASSPDKSALALWFKFATITIDPIVITMIDPYKQADGTTPVNTGDDGTGYPLWCVLQRANGSSHNYASPYAGEFPNPSGGSANLYSLWWVTTRAPMVNQYYTECMGTFFLLSVLGGYYVYYTQYPHRRTDAWAGTGVLGEGFRPRLSAVKTVSGVKVIDPRGYAGYADGCLISDSFGGAPEDSFTISSKSYRLVLAVAIPGSTAKFSIAIRVI